MCITYQLFPTLVLTEGVRLAPQCAYGFELVLGERYTLDRAHTVQVVKHELDQKKKVKTNYYTSLTIKQGRLTE